MKYLHFIKDRKFAEYYINFINSNFDKYEHKFYILGHDEEMYKLNYTKNVKVISKANLLINIINIYKDVIFSTKVYIHYMSNFEVFLLITCPYAWKKVNWVMWGGDLYYYKARTLNFKNNFIENLRKILINNFGEISYLVKGDYELLKKWYYTNAIPKKAIYPGEAPKAFLNSTDEVCMNNNPNKINILIGNSSSESNNHFEAFDALKHLVDYDIKIYCPLSYGDVTYREMVIERGRLIFGEKFIPITEFMKIQDYYKLLGRMDIGIFPFDRQQGLGNIHALIYLKKKIYIKSNTTMWNYFIDEFNIQLYDYKDLMNIDYLQLYKTDYAKLKEDSEKIKKIYTDEYAVEIWKSNFL